MELEKSIPTVNKTTQNPRVSNQREKSNTPIQPVEGARKDSGFTVPESPRVGGAKP